MSRGFNDAEFSYSKTEKFNNTLNDKPPPTAYVDSSQKLKEFMNNHIMEAFVYNRGRIRQQILYVWKTILK